VAHEATLLREASDAGVAVLGICFGSQLLARALGGQALPAKRAEIGWVQVRTDDPALVPRGPWFQWHHDTFTPPAGAVVLADSAVGPQAYTLGRSLGVQFHPEVTNEIVEEWVSLGGDDLARHGVDPDRLLGETRELAGENRLRTWGLLDAFIDRVARMGRAV
jgi:GMP synthase-like glutamine amidotransferase